MPFVLEETVMQRTIVIAAIALSTLGACNRTGDEQRANANTGQAPSAVGASPSPSDAKEPAFTEKEPKAGSAIGGTQGGNTTDPQGSTPKGPPVESSKTPQPTAGDGTPQSEKGSAK